MTIRWPVSSLYTRSVISKSAQICKEQRSFHTQNFLVQVLFAKVYPTFVFISPKYLTLVGSKIVFLVLVCQFCPSLQVLFSRDTTLKHLPLACMPTKESARVFWKNCLIRGQHHLIIPSLMKRARRWIDWTIGSLWMNQSTFIHRERSLRTLEPASPPSRFNTVHRPPTP